MFHKYNKKAGNETILGNWRKLFKKYSNQNGLKAHEWDEIGKEERSTLQSSLEKESSIMQYCPHCGKENAEVQQFCSSCGKPLTENIETKKSLKSSEKTEQKATGKIWASAIIWAIILPIVGVIIGIVNLAKGGQRKTPGLIGLLLSIFFIIIYVMIIPNGGSSRSNYTTRDNSSSISTEKKSVTENIEEIIKKGDEAYDRDDYAAALSEYQKVIDSGSNDGVIWYKYAYCNTQVNGFEIHLYETSYNLLKKQNPEHTSYFPQVKNTIF